MPELKSPFIYFGGKSSVADEIWNAFGDVDNYVEPFFGSGAVLLVRPRWTLGIRYTETVNDADGFLANFWRALQSDPEGVAYHADWPVNESDLESRHLWLVNRRKELTDKLNDPDFYDSKMAGWWVWGINCWIGSGWCSGKGPWILDASGKRIIHRSDDDDERGVNRQLPHLGGDGRGVNRKRPHLGGDGRGVKRQLPHLGNDGQGINRQLPHLGGDGQGVNRKRPHLGGDGQGLRDYLGQLAQRLRWVRVCCGDWSRITGPAVTVSHGVTAVFLDPPYSAEAGRDMNCYAVDCGKIAHEARAWCEQWGVDSQMRICLAGYAGEGHEALEKLGWRVFEWKAAGGYENQANGDDGPSGNCRKERLWFSPHCVEGQMKLF